MRAHPRALGALALLAALCAALVPSPAAAEDVVLRPRFRPGDTYELSLQVTTVTDGASGGEAGASFAENVRLRYDASVTVLEVNADARPVRERHANVQLTFDRPGESGTLFQPGVIGEVRRTEGIELYLGGRRAEPRLEKIVADVLDQQFDFTLEPALLEPGRPVEVGESWALEPSLAKRFLSSRGIRVLALGDGAAATLHRERGENGASALAVEYTIPIERFELRTMPERGEATRSEARLEGRVRLSAEPGRRPASTFSSLALELGGVSTGTEQPVPWSLRSTVIVQTAPPEPPGAASAEPPAH